VLSDLVGGPLTGGGVNPARALGPMIVAGEFGDVWVYILAPLVGGAVAAFAGDFCLRAFEGDDEVEAPRADRSR